MSRKATRGKPRRTVVLGLLGFVVLMLALTAAWHWTPLHEYAQPRHIAHWLHSMARTPWMPLVAALVFVGASLVMFPNTVLCLAIIIALGPVMGAAYAYAGSLVAAFTGWLIGRRGGKRVSDLGAFAHASAELRKGGFARILSLRMLPVVPFSATNILSGAARAPLVPYLVATFVGVSPYILAFAALGHQARRLLIHPNPTDAAIALAVAIAMSAVLWQARSWAAARAK